MSTFTIEQTPAGLWRVTEQGAAPNCFSTRQKAEAYVAKRSQRSVLSRRTGFYGR